MFKIKKFNFLSFILGGIVFSSLTVFASSVLSSQISFTTSKNANVHTVEDALNDLYNSKSSSKSISCIYENGAERPCPTTFTQGDRIAIRNGAIVQTFRYLRTTSTDSMLSECGGAGTIGDDGNEFSSKACADSSNGVHRFLAEYNLKRTGDSTRGTAIAADALQDPSDASISNGLYYGASNSDYNQSYLKTYLDNYATVLNGLIGKSNAVTVDAMTYPEIKILGWDCPASDTGTCSNIPTWAKNSYYWLGSAYDNYRVWGIYNLKLCYDPKNSVGNGARAVVNIPSSLF